jgi:hypothetical protein
MVALTLLDIDTSISIYSNAGTNFKDGNDGTACDLGEYTTSDFCVPTLTPDGLAVGMCRHCRYLANNPWHSVMRRTNSGVCGICCRELMLKDAKQH